jgi:hypothetical protein
MDPLKMPSWRTFVMNCSSSSNDHDRRLPDGGVLTCRVFHTSLMWILLRHRTHLAAHGFAQLPSASPGPTPASAIPASRVLLSLLEGAAAAAAYVYGGQSGHYGCLGVFVLCRESAEFSNSVERRFLIVGPASCFLFFFFCGLAHNANPVRKSKRGRGKGVRDED